MNVVRAIGISAGFSSLLLVTAPLQMLIVIIAPRFQHVLPKWVYGAAARLMGAKLRVQGVPPVSGPVLIAANHVSWIDIIAIGATVPCFFIAKRDVRSWPVFGPLARLLQTCFVDREKRSAVGAVRQEMAGRFRQGHILVLFPEGTSTDGRQVLNFKSALFPSDEPPIQPLTICYSDDEGRDGVHYGWYSDRELLAHMWAVFKGGPLQVDLIFHARMEVQEGQTRKDRAARAEQYVREGLALARKDAKETSQTQASR
ncbi:MAG: lysophospholipid acyltransferase family protein [Pseudomonadota bacterium]